MFVLLCDDAGAGCLWGRWEGVWGACPVWVVAAAGGAGEEVVGECREVFLSILDDLLESDGSSHIDSVCCSLMMQSAVL